VRLDADASGGELHVRADVVGDDGRAQSFRRLLVHVAGPDGFSREVPLEAVGAGAYAATVPLSRPGTYVAVARDEMGGGAVGTTGAVLGAGEELRPTGSDVAMLARIAELTGGKKRDGLAGIFHDRATKRFAYEDATSTLVVLAACALLLAVAARRLSVPDALLALPARLRARFARRASTSAAPSDAATVLSSLLAARERTRAARDAPPPAAVPPAPSRAAHPPAAAPPAAAFRAPAASAPREPAQAPAPRAPAPPGPNAKTPPKSAAEILLERRKRR
jgi:hypothetical protein